MTIFDYLADLQYHTRVGGLKMNDYIIVGFVLALSSYVYMSKMSKNNNNFSTFKVDKFAQMWIIATAAFYAIAFFNKEMYRARINNYKENGYDADEAKQAAMADIRNTRRGSLY